MGIPTDPNQPANQQATWDGAIKPPVIEWIKNNPSTTQHLPCPDSSWFESLSYDSSTLRLTVTTKNGDSWQHGQVYSQAFTDLQLAPSKGSHYSKNIKGQHPTTHIIRKPSPHLFPKEKTHEPKDRFQNPLHANLGRYQSQGRYADPHKVTAKPRKRI